MYLFISGVFFVNVLKIYAVLDFLFGWLCMDNVDKEIAFLCHIHISDDDRVQALFGKLYCILDKLLYLENNKYKMYIKNYVFYFFHF